MRKLALLFLFFVFFNHVFSQVAINNTGADANEHAILDISSTDKGMLIPRVNTTQRTAMANTLVAADDGMMVYDNETKSFWVWVWESGSGLWEDLYGADDDFYRVPGTNPPYDINDDIYTMGKVAVGYIPGPPYDNGAQLDVLIGTANNPHIGVRTKAINGLPNDIYAYNFFDESNTNTNHYGMYNHFHYGGSYTYGLSNHFELGAVIVNSYTYGVENIFSGPFAVNSFGVSNTFNQCNGNKTGFYNNIISLGHADERVSGLDNYFSGNAAANRSFGVNNDVSSTGTGSKTGVQTVFRSSATGDTLFGARNIFQDGSSGYHYGSYNEFSGDGTHVGSYYEFSGGGTHVGISTSGVNTGMMISGTGVGVTNYISGSGTMYGVQNSIGNPSTGEYSYGVFNELGISDGVTYGTYNEFTGSAPGVTVTAYGTYNDFTFLNTGFTNVSGDMYGTYTVIEDTISNSGNRYGEYVTISNIAGGTHYGLYCNVLKPGSFAGYFLGTVAVGTTNSNMYSFPASRGTSGQVMQTNGSGNLLWVDASDMGSDDADFYEVGSNTPPDDIGNDIYTFGNVIIGSNMTPVARLHVEDGRVEFTGTTDASGTPGSGVLEIGNSLRIDNDEIITNTGSPLLLQYGNGGDLTVDNNTLVVDASANRVGIGTLAPIDRFHVSGGRVEFTNTNDASGTAGTGVLEIGNTLRIDGDEIITNTNSILYLQNDNGGDLRVDNNTFIVDASANRVGIGTTAPSEILEVANASHGYGRMVVSDGNGTNRSALLLVSPTSTVDYARIEAYKYPIGGGSGRTLQINTAGHGNVVSGGHILPQSDKGYDLGSSSYAWDDIYYDDLHNMGAAAFTDRKVTEELLRYEPKPKPAGAYDEKTEKGLKELDPNSLPPDLKDGYDILTDEMTTNNNKANYEQQLQSEKLKKENEQQQEKIRLLEEPSWNIEQLINK